MNGKLQKRTTKNQQPPIVNPCKKWKKDIPLNWEIESLNLVCPFGSTDKRIYKEIQLVQKLACPSATLSFLGRNLKNKKCISLSVKNCAKNEDDNKDIIGVTSGMLQRSLNQNAAKKCFNNSYKLYSTAIL